MTRSVFSHRDCGHPSTSKARAQCRKEMAEAAAKAPAAKTPKKAATTKPAETD
jgi:hypothetical protein